MGDAACFLVGDGRQCNLHHFAVDAPCPFHRLRLGAVLFDDHEPLLVQEAVYDAFARSGSGVPIALEVAVGAEERSLLAGRLLFLVCPFRFQPALEPLRGPPELRVVYQRRVAAFFDREIGALVAFFNRLERFVFDDVGNLRIDLLKMAQRFQVGIGAFFRFGKLAVRIEPLPLFLCSLRRGDVCLEKVPVSAEALIGRKRADRSDGTVDGIADRGIRFRHRGLQCQRQAEKKQQTQWHRLPCHDRVEMQL